jgi:hypothetical protein
MIDALPHSAHEKRRKAHASAYVHARTEEDTRRRKRKKRKIEKSQKPKKQKNS